MVLSKALCGGNVACMLADCFGLKALESQLVICIPRDFIAIDVHMDPLLSIDHRTIETLYTYNPVMHAQDASICRRFIGETQHNM